MTALDLVTRLKSLGVRLSLSGNDLKVKAPKGVLDESIRAELKLHKESIVSLLAGNAESSSIKLVSRQSPLAITGLQARFLFLTELNPDSPAYFLPNLYRLEGELSIESLSKAVRTVVERHEALRTVFVEVDGQLVQSVSEHAQHEFTVVDVGDAAETLEAVEQRARALADEEANRGFDLGSGPLLRVVVYRCGQGVHLLGWYLHHVISDGWSSMIFLQELKALYEAQQLGVEASLEPVGLHYADFGVWEQQQLDQGVYDTQLDYWRERFAQPPEPLQLPTDRLRPPVMSYRGAALDFSLADGQMAQVREFAREQGVSPFVVLLSAFKVLLHRYSAQDEVCVGTPVARRNSVESEGIYGCLINSLAIRTDLSDDPSVLGYVQRVADEFLSAFANQDVPFDRVVEEVHPTRSIDTSVLFQAMFIYHVQDKRKVESLGDVSLQPLDIHATGSKFDVTLELVESGDGVRGFIEYSTDLFEASTIERMVQAYCTLLEQMLLQPQLSVSAVPLLTEQEQKDQLLRFNAQESPVAVESLQVLPQSVLAQSQRCMQKVAVVDSMGQSLSYSQLDQASNTLAHRLVDEGVGPGDRVGIYMDRRVQMLVALLGVMRSGAAYVPLDPMFPAARLEYMVEDAQLSLVVSESGLVGSVPGGEGVRSLLLNDALHGETDGEPLNDQPSLNRAQLSNIAYVIYTSGSTGQPKGVEVTHRSLSNFVASMQQEPGIGADDVLLAVTTLSFDIAALELYVPLVSGARVVLASREESMDPTRLSQLIESEQISVMQATPSSWKMLLSDGWSGSESLKVLCGGEPLSRDVADALLERCGQLWNLYGPTETTIWSTLSCVERDEGSVDIGHPVANTQVYVLDGGAQVQPPGIIGELCIGGLGVAKGYLHREQLTAERFVPDRFGADGQARMYRTGDRARWSADGRLQVLGRLDEQVKLRGYRLEPGEIRARLVEQSDVSDALVRVVVDESAQERLAGYVIGASSEPGDAVDTVSLRERLKQQLPEYMVPSVWVELESWPRTPNGKIDVKRLPQPQSDNVGTGQLQEQASTEAQKQVAQLWQKVLGGGQVDIRRSFFDQGGHSLLAVKLVNELREQLGVSVNLVELFQGINVSDIAQRIEAPSVDGGTSVQNSTCTLLTPWAYEETSKNRLVPLFMVGSNPMYKAAVSALKPGQAVYRLDAYALQAFRVSQKKLPYRSVEKIAQDMLSEMRKIQPNGPYLIGGGCEGSMIAFELARQLQEQDERVELLMTWGTSAPGDHVAADFKGSSLRRLWWQFHSIQSKGSMKELGWRGYLQLLNHEVIEHSLFSAMLSYKPREKVHGSMHLVVLDPFEGSELPEDHTLGWRHYMTCDIEVCRLPGNHDTWLKEHINDFAVFLANRLEPRVNVKVSNGQSAV